MVSRPQHMSAHPEKILHEAVHRHEALHVGGRLESPHLALALTGRLMRDLRSIVFVRHCQVDVERTGSAADEAMTQTSDLDTRHLTPDPEGLGAASSRRAGRPDTPTLKIRVLFEMLAGQQAFEGGTSRSHCHTIEGQGRGCLMEVLAGVLQSFRRLSPDEARIALYLTLAFLAAPGVAFLAFVFVGRPLGRPISITTRQSVVTILTPIKLCRTDTLKKLLLSESEKNVYKGLFDGLKKVHFARWAMLPGETLPGGRNPYFKDELLFHAIVDGDHKTFLKGLVTEGRRALDAIYGQCKGARAGKS